MDALAAFLGSGQRVKKGIAREERDCASAHGWTSGRTVGEVDGAGGPKMNGLAQVSPTQSEVGHGTIDGCLRCMTRGQRQDRFAGIHCAQILWVNTVGRSWCAGETRAGGVVRRAGGGPDFSASAWWAGHAGRQGTGVEQRDGRDAVEVVVALGHAPG